MSLELLAKRVNQRLELFSKQSEERLTVSQEVEIIRKVTEKYNGEFLTINSIWEDITAKLRTNQFYAVSAVGGQGSGKSNLGKEFFVIALKESMKCIYALPEDFLNDIEGWLSRVFLDYQGEDVCVLADDLSYSNDAQSRKNQALFKNFIARIRHRFSEYAKEHGKKVKVLIVYVTHRLHAAPPMLRNSGSWIFTEMQSADRDDCLEIIGKNKELRERLEYIYSFLNEIVFEGAKNGIIKFELDGKKISFEWGSDDNPGDGRLMCIYHAGKLNIYNTKRGDDKLDFNKYRYLAPEIEEE